MLWSTYWRLGQGSGDLYCHALFSWHTISLFISFGITFLQIIHHNLSVVLQCFMWPDSTFIHNFIYIVNQLQSNRERARTRSSFLRPFLPGHGGKTLNAGPPRPPPRGTLFCRKFVNIARPPHHHHLYYVQSFPTLKDCVLVS